MMSKFSQLKPGDKVTRLLGGTVAMPLEVTAVTEDKIICGAWEFDRETGYEIDEDLGWDGKTRTGSMLKLIN